MNTQISMHKPDLSSADQCVMCGMCQPHCPTYNADNIESESPRGRLSMILGISQQQLAIDESIAKHLNNCSGCGACEAMCPSRVPFTLLIDNSKQLLPNKSLILKALLFLVRYPKRYLLLGLFLRNSFFGNLLRLFKLLDQDSKNLQTIATQAQNCKQLLAFYPATLKARGNVGLFTGCITQLFDQKTLTDTIALLTHCGYNVHVSEQQVCCGALHQHNGELDAAELLVKQNQQVFGTSALDAVIFTSTGCGAQLNTQLKDIKVFDIMQFINENELLSSLKLADTPSNVLIHEPCSQRNQLKLPSISSLMKCIPGLIIKELADNKFCCGSGGINMLTIPESANKLRAPKIADIHKQKPDIVVTTNYGCALHLASGLLGDTNKLSQDKQIEFCHPVSLLVRSASLQ